VTTEIDGFDWSRGTSRVKVSLARNNSARSGVDKEVLLGQLSVERTLPVSTGDHMHGWADVQFHQIAPANSL
jgi:hypothetical protein